MSFITALSMVLVLLALLLVPGQGQYTGCLCSGGCTNLHADFITDCDKDICADKDCDMICAGQCDQCFGTGSVARCIVDADCFCVSGPRFNPSKCSNCPRLDDSSSSSGGEIYTGGDYI